MSTVKAIAVKTWRNRTKDRMIEAMGGKCVCCGYNSCRDAFDFHHLKPEEKRFSFGGMRANPIAWIRIVEELRKCILVCANCHREIEAGKRDIENLQSTFNEQYVEYTIGYGRSGRLTDVKGKCKHCSNEFSKYRNTQKYCSDVCQIGANKKKNDIVRKKLDLPPKPL
jgi:hypothetical protein